MGGAADSKDTSLAATTPTYLKALAFLASAGGNVGLNLFNSWSLRSTKGVEPSW